MFPFVYRFDTEGQNQSFQAYSSSGGGAATFRKDEFKTLEEVVSSELGMHGDKPEFFSTRATITFVKQDNLSYPACPADKCNKKMTMEDTDVWRCEKCQTTYPAPEYR